MAEEYVLCNKSDLVSVADSIRTKSGTSGVMRFPQDFVDGVSGIEAGGGDGSVDTCAVNFTTNGMGCVLHLTTINNGVVSITSAPGSTVVKTVNNVICNSIAVVEPVFTELADVLIDGDYYGVTLFDVYGASVIIPDKKDGTVTISVTIY